MISVLYSNAVYAHLLALAVHGARLVDSFPTEDSSVLLVVNILFLQSVTTKEGG